MREFTEEQWEEVLNAAGKNRTKVAKVADAMAAYEPAANVLVEGADAPPPPPPLPTVTEEHKDGE